MDLHPVLQDTLNPNAVKLDSPSQPNRKWLGAMALMQLASNDDATGEASSDLVSPAKIDSQPIYSVVMDELLDPQLQL